ncbi:hypothetical protein DFJ74DRAFT_91554 [Hyaloraphidium curvatum]|nr:hypothetical protein DFJ74DRAFT_91554 [Hyaloraphidium curvatum]
MRRRLPAVRPTGPRPRRPVRGPAPLRRKLARPQDLHPGGNLLPLRVPPPALSFLHRRRGRSRRPGTVLPVLPPPPPPRIRQPPHRKVARLPPQHPMLPPLPLGAPQREPARLPPRPPFGIPLPRGEPPLRPHRELPLPVLPHRLPHLLLGEGIGPLEVQQLAADHQPDGIADARAEGEEEPHARDRVLVPVPVRPDPRAREAEGLGGGVGRALGGRGARGWGDGAGELLRGVARQQQAEEGDGQGAVDVGLVVRGHGPRGGGERGGGGRVGDREGRVDGEAAAVVGD